MTVAVPIPDCYERPLSGIEYRDVNFRCGLISDRQSGARSDLP